MIQATFDIPMPNSCKECPFLVHCDECESWENYCPLIREHVGYDDPRYVIKGSPITPSTKRKNKCPLREVKENKT